MEGGIVYAHPPHTPAPLGAVTIGLLPVECTAVDPLAPTSLNWGTKLVPSATRSKLSSFLALQVMLLHIIFIYFNYTSQKLFKECSSYKSFLFQGCENSNSILNKLIKVFNFFYVW